MNILWLSNIRLANSTQNKSGTWIYSMYRELINNPEVRIVGNVTIGNVSNPHTNILNGMEEYVLPSKWINKDGLPFTKMVENVRSIIDKLCPDIIHVWGLELCWGYILNKITPPPSLSLSNY